jgi:poly(3-hydroxybutyrate) depolymerase
VGTNRILSVLLLALSCKGGSGGSSNGMGIAGHVGTPAQPTAGGSEPSGEPPGPSGGFSVPGEALVAEKSSCPVGFTEELKAGRNTGFQSGGQARSFEVLLPPKYFSGPRPLLMAFHGTGLSGAGAVADYRLQEWADQGFIVVAPDSNGNGSLWPVWDMQHMPGTPETPNADLALFDDLIQCVAAHHSVDEKRIYAGGQSAGGTMTNFLLGRRSKVLAGGVPASSTFDLTQPTPVTPIDPVTVIVTWGGDNDRYSGGAGNYALSNAEYAEQASLAAQYWERQPGVNQITCKGKDLGHIWLWALNRWMIDVLLAHPKGYATDASWVMPGVPSSVPVACNEEAYVYSPPVTVDCPTSATPGCQAYCQLAGDCVIENGTLGPMAVPQLQALGFSEGANVCSGCLARCAEDAQGSRTDATVLDCISKATTSCGPGYAGAAFFTSVNGCCSGRTNSRICERYCSTFRQNASFAPIICR